MSKEESSLSYSRAHSYGRATNEWTSKAPGKIAQVARVDSFDLQHAENDAKTISYESQVWTPRTGCLASSSKQTSGLPARLRSSCLCARLSQHESDDSLPGRRAHQLLQRERETKSCRSRQRERGQSTAAGNNLASKPQFRPQADHQVRARKRCKRARRMSATTC